MDKEFEEALNETVNKFADVILQSTNEPKNATNLTDAINYLEKTPQIIALRKYGKALRIVSQHLKFEDGGTAIIKNFINDKEETKHIIKVVSEDTGAAINILLDTKEEFDTLMRWQNE